MREIIAMLIQQDKGEHRIRITHYSETQLKINDTFYSMPIVITPREIIDIEMPSSFAALDNISLSHLLKLSPDVFIIGTGKKSQFLPLELEALCAQHQQVIDTMSTDAACRTYTLLATEGRRVLSVLFES